MNLRPLTESDLADWRTIRLRMLRERPEAFGEDADDFAGRTDEEVRARLRDANLIGLWRDGALVGTIGWARSSGRKRRHLARIWGMYVATEARGTGGGRLLLRAAFDASREAGVTVWDLGVEEQNAVAIALYESEGFSRWGLERDAYRQDGRSINIIHMSRHD